MGSTDCRLRENDEFQDSWSSLDASALRRGDRILTAPPAPERARSTHPRRITLQLEPMSRG